MERMTFQLKNIHFSERLSQETNAYSADLYIDGKKACVVGNEGHGGCDSQCWLDHDLRRRAETYIATLPPKVTDMDASDYPTGKLTYPQDVETICGDLFAEWLNAKEVKRELSKALLFLLGPSKELREIKWKGKKPTEAQRSEARTQLLAKYGKDVTFLDDLSATEAGMALFGTPA